MTWHGTRGWQHWQQRLPLTAPPAPPAPSRARCRMQYLQWYHEVLEIPVQNSTRVQLIEPLDAASAEAGFRVTVARCGERQVMHARKVVLATGIQGGGEWHVPQFVKDAVPRQLYAHTSEAIDFAALKGKRVAILGGEEARGQLQGVCLLRVSWDACPLCRAPAWLPPLHPDDTLLPAWLFPDPPPARSALHCAPCRRRQCV